MSLGRVVRFPRDGRFTPPPAGARPPPPTAPAPRDEGVPRGVPGALARAVLCSRHGAGGGRLREAFLHIDKALKRCPGGKGFARALGSASSRPRLAARADRGLALCKRLVHRPVVAMDALLEEFGSGGSGGRGNARGGPPKVGQCMADFLSLSIHAGSSKQFSPRGGPPAAVAPPPPPGRGVPGTGGGGGGAVGVRGKQLRLTDMPALRWRSEADARGFLQ
jgi:hypothetical protein